MGSLTSDEPPWFPLIAQETGPVHTVRAAYSKFTSAIRHRD